MEDLRLGLDREGTGRARELQHPMQYDKPEYVSRFAAQRALPFLVAYDHDGQAAKAWGDVRLTPTTFLLDKQGRIVKRYVGQPDFAALHAQIEKLLAE